MSAPRKIAFIGGGGVRTPLVIFGLNEAAGSIGGEELSLYDIDQARAGIMAALGAVLVARQGGALRIRVTRSFEEAVEGASFVLHSIRVGGIASRAADERLAIDHNYPGQETTGPAGVAMALRTVPIALEHARLVERWAPQAWFINFTNPAGLITQAISQHTRVRVVGICDTPTELFHRIAIALNASPGDVRCEYLGLNHLGWVRRVFLHGEDVTAELLASDASLRSLYSADLFDPELIRALGLIPTEYLYFYYCRRRALANQCAAGATRGEEVARLNETLLQSLSSQLAAGDSAVALGTYVSYLNQRSGSYMKLEASAGSAYDRANEFEGDPFRTATGYHRIALDVINALSASDPKRVVVNIPNQGAICDLSGSDVVEVPCAIGAGAITPEPCGALPEAVRGLVLAVKAYEHAAIDAAVMGSAQKARAAMLLYPAIGEWEPACDLMRDFIQQESVDLEHVRRNCLAD